MLLTSKTRPQGGSIATTIPTEVSRRMGLAPGMELCWYADGEGGYHVRPMTEQTREFLEAHEAVIEQHRDLFDALSK